MLSGLLYKTYRKRKKWQSYEIKNYGRAGAYRTGKEEKKYGKRITN